MANNDSTIQHFEAFGTMQEREPYIIGPFLGMRHMQAFLIFLDIVVVYFSRLNVSVAIVAMTNAATTNPNFPAYNWNEKHKSYILSSFYWGYVITQFPGSFLCRRFGAKSIMFFATFGSAVFSVITPFCIPWGGWKIFCAIRIMQGLCQGMFFPCIHEHLAKWSPPLERNRLGALSHTGIECGNVLAMLATGFIAHSSLGWPGISYISAGLCFGWCALWLIFGANSPPESRFISDAECKYIQTSLQQKVENIPAKQVPVPWRAIWTSAPFIALIIARCAQGWGFSTLQAELPSYLNGVLHMEIKSNAVFSALPYMAMWCMSYVYIILADVIIKKKLLSLSALRKTFNSIAEFVPALTLIGVGFLDENHKTFAIVLFTTNVGINAGVTIGCTLNSIDLSPTHAVTLMGMVNTIANFTSLLTPLLVGIIVVDESDRYQWQVVFIIAAVVFIVGNVIYIIWGSAEAQPWNADDFLLGKDEEKCVNEKKEHLNIEDVKSVEGNERKISLQSNELRRTSIRRGSKVD